MTEDRATSILREEVIRANARLMDAIANLLNVLAGPEEDKPVPSDDAQT